MNRALVQRVRQSIRQLISRPRKELTRGERAARFALDLVRYCTQQLVQDRASQMAAALTYRTIFSLVPMLVLGVLIFRAFGGFEQMDMQARQTAFNYLGLSTISLEDAQADEEEGQLIVVDPAAPAQDQATLPAPVQAEENRELAASVDRIINDLTQKSENISFGSIGAVGLLLFLVAALGLVSTVEDCFNRVYNSAAGRPWHLRIPIYWAVMTLGPFLLMVTLYVAGKTVAWLDQQYWLSFVPLLKLLSYTAAFLSSWLLLFLLFVLMPNTRVDWRSALAGSFISAALWETGKWAFKLYISYLRESGGGYTVIYGSLALIPLFLLWVYVTWLTVLFGLEFTYTLQAIHGGHFEEQEQLKSKLIYDPRVLIPLMVLVGRAFVQGRGTALEELASELRLPGRAVEKLAQCLHEESLVHWVVQGAGRKLALAKPPEQIRIEQLLELGWQLSFEARHADRPAQSVFKELEEAERQVAGNRTLADLINAK